MGPDIVTQENFSITTTTSQSNTYKDLLAGNGFVEDMREYYIEIRPNNKQR